MNRQISQLEKCTNNHSLYTSFELLERFSVDPQSEADSKPDNRIDVISPNANRLDRPADGCGV